MNEHFEATIMHETADAEKDNSRPSSAAVRWLQLKYVLIALVALAGLIFLSRSGALAGLNGLVADVTTLSSEWGLVGMFLLGLLANAVLIVQVPYLLPLFIFALDASNSVWMLLPVSIATGIGAGMGEIVSYAIAYQIAARSDAFERSALLNWIQDKITRYPRTTTLFIFLSALLPVPDDLVIIPLALIRYPLRYVLLPMFLGKIVLAFSFALLFRFVSDVSGMSLDAAAQVDFSVGLIIGFVLLILYQIERSRLTETPA
jgi:membrane protein YqaA with SNARE-associated domain